MPKKLRVRPSRTRVEFSASMSATSRSTETANHRALREALFLASVGLWWKHGCGETSIVTCALQSKPGSLTWRNSDQRNALCTSRAAQLPTITNTDKRKTSVGKPGDGPSWHGPSAACTCRQTRSEADSANRSNLYDSNAHPAWPSCRPVFQSLLRTSTMA